MFKKKKKKLQTPNRIALILLVVQACGTSSNTSFNLSVFPCNFLEKKKFGINFRILSRGIYDKYDKLYSG